MMNTKKLIFLSVVLMLETAPVLAGDHDPKRIAALLKNSKVTLLEGVTYAEKVSGVATSAKFEVSDEGNLELSVYTVPEGLAVEPENATLTELSGSAADAPSALKVEVFTDKEHLTRSSVHMTLFQMSKLNLKQVILKAQSYAKGIAIDVRNPMVKNARPVADVVLVCDKENISIVTIDLLSGNVIH